MPSPNSGHRGALARLSLRPQIWATWGLRVAVGEAQNLGHVGPWRACRRGPQILATWGLRVAVDEAQILGHVGFWRGCRGPKLGYVEFPQL